MAARPLRNEADANRLMEAANSTQIRWARADQSQRDAIHAKAAALSLKPGTMQRVPAGTHSGVRAAALRRPLFERLRRAITGEADATEQRLMLDLANARADAARFAADLRKVREDLAVAEIAAEEITSRASAEAAQAHLRKAREQALHFSARLSNQIELNGRQMTELRQLRAERDLLVEAFSLRGGDPKQLLAVLKPEAA